MLDLQHGLDNSKHLRLNDSVGDSTSVHKNQFYITQERYQKQPNSPSTVKTKNPSDPRRKTMSENINESNRKILVEKRIDNSPNYFERVQNTRNQQNQTAYLPVNNKLNYSISK